MKRGYYIHFDARISPGVSKKIDMQIRELRKSFDMEEINIRAKDCSLVWRVLRLLPGGAISRTYDEALEQIIEPDFLYIRRATADKEYVNFFKEIRRRWPNCKILVEIFTFPYDKDEFLRTFAWPFYFKEAFNRKKIYKYIDRYVTFSEKEMIFSVPTIQTGNGIEVSKVIPLKADRWKADTLNLIAVAYMQKHHGYERLIKGLYQYYRAGGKRNIYLHLVGDGPEKKKYISLVGKYHLEKNVLFYANTLGEELDQLYEKADLAISSLGWYKDGVNHESSIKVREYMAKGFPTVIVCPVNGVEEDFEYLFQLPNNKSVIQIEDLLDYYDKIVVKKSRTETTDFIRKKAFSYADMSVVMKPIVEFVERHEK